MEKQKIAKLLNQNATPLQILQKKLKLNKTFLKRLYQLAECGTHSKQLLSFQNKANQKIQSLFSSIKNIQKMSSLANQVYKITFFNQAKVICKIYHNFLQQFTNKKLEQLIVKTMSAANQYPQIYFSDLQCRVQGFIQAKPICNNQLNYSLLQKITRKLAQFSQTCSLNMKKFNNQNLQPKRNINSLFKIFHTVFQKKSKQCPQKVQNSRFFVEKILSKQIQDNLYKLLSPTYIASHNDCNLSNILLKQGKESQQDVILIDFQFADLNYIGFDLGNFFNELATDYSSSFQIKKQWELSSQVKQKLSQVYFSCLPLPNQEKNKINIQSRKKAVDLGRMISHLYWLFVGLKQINDPNVSLDMNYYIKRRYQQFSIYYNKFQQTLQG